MKLLGILIVLLMANAGLMAQTAIAPSAGDGTVDNPYEIATLENLYWIAATDNVVPDPDRATRWSSHYIQTADIDAFDTENWFNGAGWIPIGYYASQVNYLSFDGSYDGQEHTIDGLYINRPNTNCVGLFGRTEGASIENLGVINVNISGDEIVGGLVGWQVNGAIIKNSFSTGSVSGVYTRTGGLVGRQDDGSTITNSYSTASVNGDWITGGGLIGYQKDSSVSNSYSTGSVSSGWISGGLVGYQWNSDISNCHSTGTVTGLENTGGLVGRNDYNSTISDSYSSGTVIGDWYTGGLVGEQRESSISNSYSTGDVNGDWVSGGLVAWDYDSTISNSYSTGNVIGRYFVGGFAGEIYLSTISNCYSTGSVAGGSATLGGLVGNQSHSTVIYSYWNTETSGLTWSDAGEGRTTAEMTYPHAANTYVDWDFDEIWNADENFNINNGYPYLQGIDYPVSVEDDIIADLQPVKLYNYPNPFNPETNIRFTIPAPGKVELTIYNIRGERIATLLDDYREAGEHSVLWRGKNDEGRPVSSGVYFYRLSTPNAVSVDKMLLLK